MIINVPTGTKEIHITFDGGLRGVLRYESITPKQLKERQLGLEYFIHKKMKA
jgi:hypothetical protein